MQTTEFLEVIKNQDFVKAANWLTYLKSLCKDANTIDQSNINSDSLLNVGICELLRSNFSSEFFLEHFSLLAALLNEPETFFEGEKLFASISFVGMAQSAYLLLHFKLINENFKLRLQACSTNSQRDLLLKEIFASLADKQVDKPLQTFYEIVVLQKDEAKTIIKSYNAPSIYRQKFQAYFDQVLQARSSTSNSSEAIILGLRLGWSTLLKKLSEEAMDIDDLIHSGQNCLIKLDHLTDSEDFDLALTIPQRHKEGSLIKQLYNTGSCLFFNWVKVITATTVNARKSTQESNTPLKR